MGEFHVHAREFPSGCTFFHEQGILVEFLEGRGYFIGVVGVSSADGHHPSEHVAQVREKLTTWKYLQCKPFVIALSGSKRLFYERSAQFFSGV